MYKTDKKTTYVFVQDDDGPRSERGILDRGQEKVEEVLKRGHRQDFNKGERGRLCQRGRDVLVRVNVC